MRCFVAVTVGASITEAMAAELPALRASAERCGLAVSWSRREGWHATIKFLGALDEERTSEVRRCLPAAAAAIEPFEVEATGVIALPQGRRPPGVLAVALSDARGCFAQLARGVEEALERIGFAREQRPLLPHVTLGRIRGSRGWRRFACSPATLGDRPLGTGEVRAMTLYRSILGDGPASYDVVESFALGRGTVQT